MEYELRNFLYKSKGNLLLIENLLQISQLASLLFRSFYIDRIKLKEADN
jgi:hypothetical protein